MSDFCEAAPEELTEIAEFFSKRNGDQSTEEVLLELEQYIVIKIPHYICDGPGYRGPVWVIIWGEPGIVSVLTRAGRDTLHCIEGDLYHYESLLEKHR